MVRNLKLLGEIVHEFCSEFPGESGLWDCGITFDIFTHDCSRVVFFLFLFIFKITITS